MNNFPCKNCLVKACCSEYCDQLESIARVIDIHLVSLKQCPDCGATINQGSSLNKTTKICFECCKVFQQETILKMSVYKNCLGPKTPTLSSNSGNPQGTIIWGQTPVSKSIIVDITKQVSQAISESMEVTHDVFYNRKEKNESDYIIERFSISIRAEIMANPINFQHQIKIPHRFKKYPTIGPGGFHKIPQGKKPDNIIIIP